MVFVHIGIGEQSKLDAKLWKMVFLGYPQGVKRYRLCDPLEKKAIINRDVTFDKNSILQRRDGMEEQQEQQEVQQGSASQLTSYSILLLVGASGGVGIQVEHFPKVSP